MIAKPIFPYLKAESFRKTVYEANYRKTINQQIPDGRIVVNRHAIPPATMVMHKGNLRPILSSITTLISIDGISTKPKHKKKL